EGSALAAARAAAGLSPEASAALVAALVNEGALVGQGGRVAPRRAAPADPRLEAIAAALETRGPPPPPPHPLRELRSLPPPPPPPPGCAMRSAPSARGVEPFQPRISGSPQGRSTRPARRRVPRWQSGP